MIPSTQTGDVQCTGDRIDQLMRFNRYVAHDLRAPLKAVIGVTELAQASLGHGDVVRTLELLDLLSARAHALLGLVSGLLAMSTVHGEQFERSAVDLGAAARDAWSDACQQANMPTTAAVVLHPLPVVTGSASLLRQVFVNLFGNALKFSRSLDDALVEVGVAADDTAFTTVFVRDNGVGFPPQHAQRLFDSFSRFHGRDYPGHGIGLDIVKQIVERHGGQAWAEPGSPRGAVFYVRLPRRACPQQARPERSLSACAPSSERRCDVER
jgi:signal transduction histidine kinase